MTELQERIKALPEETQREIMRLVLQKGYQPIFVKEGAEVSAKESHASSSVGFYDEWWVVVAGNPEFIEVRRSKWEAGTAGGRTVYYIIRFRKGDVVRRRVSDGRSMEHRSIREVYICAD